MFDFSVVLNTTDAKGTLRGYTMENDPSQMLKCSRCSYSWVPRRDKAPERCPRCRSVKWNMPQLTVTCKRCGYTWNSHTGNPKRCPECGSHQWNVPPKSYVCKRCGSTWNTKGGKIPKRCPSCSSKEWDREKEVEVKPPRRMVFELDDDTYKTIVDHYRKGMSCVDISIQCDIPYSVVYQAIRDHIPNREIKV